jgi:hypothetical protein
MPASTLVIVGGSWLLLLALTIAFSIATRDRPE